MWRDFLVLPPLLCFMIGTWKLWEIEVDPRFGWMLVGTGFQLVFLADKVLTRSSWLSIASGVVGLVAFLYCLKKTIVAEQISKGIRERREGYSSSGTEE